ncbi:MAG: universal stress protein [Candidatus Methylacidiphilales bacterium]|nr:universal stress protein [Candidatus Methylacidiphilales bacterium]
MEINTVGRPRNVGWIRAAALLYGDWGTSKAYVLGIGLATIGFHALPHFLAVCFITALVGINYIWVCKFYPNGGGVYSAAKDHADWLAVVGALLLIADYIVTVSLSSLDAFHYLGFDNDASRRYAILSIFLVGAINFFGPKHTGGIAVWLALPTAAVVLVLLVAGTPHLSEYRGLWPEGSWTSNWLHFVALILALSGVEAIASTTGVMQLDKGSTPEKPSVVGTASKAIFVVMAEVVLATGFLCVLALCLPDEAKLHKEDLLRYMGELFVGHSFGIAVGVTFALLLLSAANTAINGLVAITYMLARDKELPDQFTQLNQFGVPWLALMFATIFPVLVLNISDTVEALAELYAIGVVGAITINLGSCALNPRLPMLGYERWTMRFTFAFMALVWISIAIGKWHALVFVIVILVAGLAVRVYTRKMLLAEPTDEQKAQLRILEAERTAHLADLQKAADEAAVESSDVRILVAARGQTPALAFAIEEAHMRKARLFVLYIREVRVNIATESDWRDDPQARGLFEYVLTTAKGKGVRVRPMYSVSNAPAETILDIIGVVDANMVILGGSRRAAFVNLVKGNVITSVGTHLPPEVKLIIIG